VNFLHASTSFGEDDEPSILGTPSTLRDLLWYPDSGTSRYLTHDSNNLTAKTSYSGPDVVKIGNNIGLSIKHVGSAIYTSPCTAHKIFFFITCYNFLQFRRIYLLFLNLIKIYVLYEFHSDFCLVERQGDTSSRKN